MLNHFAKVCRKKLYNSRNSREGNRINNVENAEASEQNTHSKNQNVNYINYNEHFHSDYDSSDDNYVATGENVDSLPIALRNMTIATTSVIYYSFPVVVVVLSICPSPEKKCLIVCIHNGPRIKPLELKSFSNNIVETLGTLKTPVRCNDWKIQKENITVVADRFRSILGRDLFDQLGITISQKPCPNTKINNIETPFAQMIVRK